MNNIQKYLSVYDEHHVANEPVSGYVTRDEWSEICEEFIDADHLTNKDWASLMAVCAMLMVDPDNTVILPSHLQHYADLLHRVYKDPLALTHLSALFGNCISQTYRKPFKV